MKIKSFNKGVTLIALVITIIVLLILAGVTIHTLTGENGILNKARTSEKENEEQTAIEIMNLKITQAQITSYGETQNMPSLHYLADRLCEDDEIAYVKVEEKKIGALDPVKISSDDDTILTKLKAYPYEFQINSSLQLATIDGKEIENPNDAIAISEISSALNEIGIETNEDETISSLAEKIRGIKISEISSALNEIGVETSENETISSLAEKIKSIKIPKITKLTINGTGAEYSNTYKFSIASYENYKNLTKDNLSIQLNNSPFRATQQSDVCGCLWYTFSYAPESGLITVTLSGTMEHQSWSTPHPNATITIIE